MIRIVTLWLLLVLLAAGPQADLMSKVPVRFEVSQGYGSEFNTSVYSGYLDLKNSSRSAHYVFVESVNGPNNKDPVTLWLNGGPGCSSLLGFLQEIGPYYLDNGKPYSKGDTLTKNQHSWHTVSNLLFLESPAGVGFSYNTDAGYVNNDENTALDSFNALLDFFKKFPEYHISRFWLAGESYAGKYIPDLAVLIDKYNSNGSILIDFRGILVGNGIMSLNHVERSEAEYLIEHSFVDPSMREYWERSCRSDPESSGCNYFRKKLQENIDEINIYNVYGYCYYNDTTQFASQESILMKLRNKMSNKGKVTADKSNAAPCAYFQGMFDYFNLHADDYKANNPGKKWHGPCNEDLKYEADPAGSIASYQHLLAQRDKYYSINLYNGNWDVVVPYRDTVYNLEETLGLAESYIYDAWFVDGQHAGFSQVYSGVHFVLVKGASHQVPQSKRPQSLSLFNSTLQGSTLRQEGTPKSGAKIDN